MQAALAFLRRDFLIAVSYRASFFMQLLGIFVLVPVYTLMGKLINSGGTGPLEKYGGNYFAFLLIGAAFIDYVYASLRTFNESLRESQLMGTLEIVLLSPTPVWQLVTFSSLWVYLLTTIRFLCYLVAGMFFGLNLSHANVFSALIVLALSIPAFASLGILSASATMLIKRGESINQGLSLLSAALGGVLYPLEVMPHWVQNIAHLLPVTPALEAMRLALLTGKGVFELLPQIIVLLAFALILLPTSLLVFAWSVKITKRSGSLAQY